jgi:hypothetical protein
MTLSTLLRYLFGAEEAIREVASHPWSLWLGLLLVLSAGFARSYAKHDLRSRPGVLLLPFAASLVSSAVLFVLIATVLWLKGVSVSASDYRPLLGLFWMTAPLAWLYGSLGAAMGHYRRYHRQGLAAHLRKAGFHIVHLSYCNAPDLVGWWLTGRVEDESLRRECLAAD